MHRYSSKVLRRSLVAALAVVLLPVSQGGSSAAGREAPTGLDGTARDAAGEARQAAPGSGGIGDPYFPLYGNGGYDARAYRLAVRYEPRTDRLTARASITARSLQELSSFHLDLVGLDVHEVTVDGEPATWVRRAGHELVVTPARPVADDAAFRTTVRYSGVPRFIESPFLGRYGFLPTSDGALAAGEPEVAAFWYPVNDHPRDKARYRVRLTVPRGLEAVSNGLRTERRVHGRWVTTSWATRDPMASYLLFAAIGHFDLHHWRTASGLPVLDAVDSGITGPLRQRIDRSLAKQGRMLRPLARWFGPYPFETIGGVVDALDIGFALENQTRPVYSTDFWEVPEAPTLGDDVVVHELAHQWYGDSVAVDRWQDIWLNEGFATYAEWLWQRAEHGFTPGEIFRSAYASIPARDGFWKLVIGDPGRERIFFGPVYLRGAMTLHALRVTIGTQDFFEVLRTWAAAHRNGNGSTAQFIRLAERISGQELSPLFDAWLFAPTKPALPGRAADGTATRVRSDRAGSDRVQAFVDRWRRGLEVRVGTRSSR